VEHLVTLLDIPVTMLSAADITVPEAMVGRDLRTALNTDDWDNEVLVQISESEVGRALRTPRWKYEIVAPENDAWNDAGASTYRESQLYDLLNDPWERQNLIASPEHAWTRNSYVRPSAAKWRRLVKHGQ
jgi:arylsulfatase A-like enzyme